MKHSWGKRAVAVAAAFLVAVALAQEASWTDTLDFTFFLSGAQPEDYGRSAPPYGRNVWIAFSFKNLTPNRTVTAVELQARYIDAFGDVITTTDPVKLELGLRPGDEGSSNQALYYEDNDFRHDLYDELVGPVENDALKGEVWVRRIAFSDGEVVSYSEEWLADELTRIVQGARTDPTAREFKSSSYDFEDRVNHFESGPLTIQAHKWRVTWLAFTAPGKTLTVQVLQGGAVVASKEFDTSDMLGGLTLENGPGTFEVVADGPGVTFTLFVHEANE